MRETLITILFPAVLYFWATPLLARISFFRRLGWLEKIIFTGATSSSIFIILASWGAVLGDGSVSLLLGSFLLLALVLFLYWLIILIRNKPQIKFPKFSKIEKLLGIVILAILLKTFVLFTLRPIVDPDILVSYLPFARTIVEENFVPPQDKYTLNPMTLPPIGGPILYATTYVLSGNTFSESFRLFTFPFFVGLIILTYLLGKKIGGRLFGLVSTLIFLSLPWIDTMLLEWVIYPDLIFAFLGLSLFYFLEFHFFDAPRKTKNILGIFFGLILAASLLLKDQGIFLFFLLFLIIILHLRGKLFRLLSLFFAILPFFLLFLKIPGLTYFAFDRASLAGLFFLGAPFIFLATRRIVFDRKIKPIGVITPLFVSLVLGTLGSLWILRNIALYAHPVVPFLGEPLATTYGAILKLGISSPAVNFELKEIQLFFLPVFGTLLLLPKILGLLASLFEKKLFQVGFWFFAWYSIVILYFGQANERYLSIVAPTLAVLIAYGVQVVRDWLQNLSTKKLNNFLPISSILFGIASLAQSTFLSWNIGSSLFPSLVLRRSLFEMPAPLTTSIFDIEQSFFSLARVLNTRPGLYSREDAIQLLIIGLLFSLIIFAVALFFLRFSFKRYILFFGFISVIVFTFPYLAVIWNTSGGNVLTFTEKERNKIYSSSGLTTHIVPYLKENAAKDSKVLVFGPDGALSYHTHLPVWNLEFGYGLSGIKDFLDKEESEILNFMNENKIEYFLLYDNEPSLSKFLRAKERSTFFTLLTNDKYFKEVIKPNEENFWAVYKLE